MKPLIHCFKKGKFSFVIISFVSLVWLILRTGRKPSRINYPCQRMAASNVGMVLSLLGFAGLFHAIHRIKYKPVLRIILIGIFISLSVFYAVFNVTFISLTFAGPGSHYPFSAHLDSLGFAAKGSGISRVVAVHNSNSTDGTDGLDNANLVGSVVTEMFNNAIKELTGAATTQSAWEQIIPDPSKKVAIKVNCQITGIYSKSKVVQPIIDGLIGRGVAADNIFIYDRRDYGFHYGGFTRNTDLADGIVNVGALETHHDFGGYSSHSALYQIAKMMNNEAGPYDVDYLINVAVLKALDGYSGVTLSMKNHYGTCTPEHPEIMTRIPQINALEQIRSKTRLLVIDSIFGQYEWTGGRNQSNIAKVNTLLLSFDTVSIDYVGWQIIEDIRTAFSLGALSPYPQFIDNAAGAPYNLGTNNPAEIELIKIDMDEPSFVYGDVSGDGRVTVYDAALSAQYSVGLITLTPDQIKAAEVSGNGAVSAYDASLIGQYSVGLISEFPVENQ